MPRSREPWELCPANTFAGIHVWQLDRVRDATGKPVKDGATIAVCHVCRSQPDWPHGPVVVQQLIEQRDRAREDARRGRLLRETFGKRRIR